MAATATIRRAASSDRSPAAIGSHGLLRRSISTSSIWLIPVMKTFTHRPASRVHSRSTAFEARPSETRRSRRGRRSTARCRSGCAGARSATARAAPTPPLAGTPVSPRAGGDSSQRKLPALWQHAADAGRLPRHRRRPALRRPARLSRRRHGGSLLALHAAAHRRRGGRHPRHQPRRAGASVGDGLAGGAPRRRGALGHAARCVGGAARAGAALRGMPSPPTSARCASTSGRGGA